MDFLAPECFSELAVGAPGDTWAWVLAQYGRSMRCALT